MCVGVGGGGTCKNSEKSNKDFILVSAKGGNGLWHAALRGISCEGDQVRPSNIL